MECLLAGGREHSGLEIICSSSWQLTLWSVRSREPVRALPHQLPQLAVEHSLVGVLVVYDLRTASCAMSNLTCPDIRSAVLVSLPQNLSVINERLLASKDPHHPGKACLEQPNKLVQVVQGDVEGLGGD